MSDTPETSLAPPVPPVTVTASPMSAAAPGLVARVDLPLDPTGQQTITPASAAAVAAFNVTMPAPETLPATPIVLGGFGLSEGDIERLYGDYAPLRDALLSRLSEIKAAPPALTLEAQREKDLGVKSTAYFMTFGED